MSKACELLATMAKPKPSTIAKTTRNFMYGTPKRTRKQRSTRDLRIHLVAIRALVFIAIRARLWRHGLAIMDQVSMSLPASRIVPCEGNVCRFRDSDEHQSLCTCVSAGGAESAFGHQPCRGRGVRGHPGRLSIRSVDPASASTGDFVVSTACPIASLSPSIGGRLRTLSSFTHRQTGGQPQSCQW